MADAAEKLAFCIEHRHATISLHFLAFRMAPDPLVAQGIGGVEKTSVVAEKDAVGGSDGDFVCRLQLRVFAIVEVKVAQRVVVELVAR